MMDRNKNGQFLPGKSPNPTGRPRSETAAIRKQLTDRTDAVIDIVIQTALTGDLQACKLVLDRVIPPLKSQTAPIVLSLPANADLTSIAKCWLNAAADGSLPADISAQMVGAVGQLARIVEINNLKDRLEALEHALKLERTLLEEGK